MLATLLYAGFVVSQSSASSTDVPITALNMPADARLANEPARRSRGPLPLDQRPGRDRVDDSFQATVDLANVDPDAGPTTVPVGRSVDPRIQVVSAEPRRVPVTLDPIKTRSGSRSRS